jgi:dTDP-4-amino-4,6-dideoxygalactose transaminase
MILMNDFKAGPRALVDAQMRAVQRVLESGWYILGREVEEFERAWAKRCEVPFAVGVGNGMDAIEMGLRALDIGPGDEVITTPMTAFATVLAIIRSGATPVLADIKPTTALLDPESVARCISPQTRAVMLVHLYGRVANMDQWEALCRNAGIALVEDCAQAHLARWRGRMAGSFGVFGAWSFYPTKNLGAVGDAGALVTSKDTVAERVRVLRNYGQGQRYHHVELGLNSRLDEVHAAILLERLAWLDEFTERRRAVARAYYEGIDNPRVRMLVPPAEEENHVYHLFVLNVDERDQLGKHLRDSDIQTLSHYPVPIHRQPPCRDLRFDPRGLPNAERHAATCLSIPCHPQLSNADVAHVIEVINAFR